MVRKTLIAGNWKMNGLLKDGALLAKEIGSEVKKRGVKNCEFLVCPPFTLLETVRKALRGSKVALGAQDCSVYEKGAHTGDVSPQMLKDLGCSYVILGHSERRANHYETSVLVCQKAESAYQAGLKAVICIGETESERDSGKTLAVCQKQIKESVPAGATALNTVIAYEPVWAIGTGKTPSVSDVAEVHAAIRAEIARKLGQATASKMRILYGGSVKPSNAAALLALEDVDGGLIGGASLRATDFMGIADAVCQS